MSVRASSCLSERLLRRHVVDRAENHPLLRDERGGIGARRRLHPDALGDAEIEHLHARAADDDVVRLDVAMDDAMLVRFGESIGDAASDAADIRLRQRAARDEGRERLAFDELHHDERAPFRFLERMDRRNVRVVELRGGSRFAPHARDCFGVRSNLLREDLDRDVAAEARVLCPPDLAHAAGADASDQLVRAEHLVGGDHTAHCRPANAGQRTTGASELVPEKYVVATVQLP
jgi:hypothetical protein